MFALPSDYVTARETGNAFAAEYYGRLNVSAKSVIGMFTERSRYYSMDSLNGRPAVGRAGVVREVRRFLGPCSGRRRFVEVVSVDAQTDAEDGGRAGTGFGRDDSDDYDYDDHGDRYDDDGQHLAVFVRAELADQTRPSLAPLPFVQMFRVRCQRTANHGHRFEITIAVVKTLVAAVRPLLQQRRRRQPDDDHKGFSNFGLVENDYKTTRGQFEQDIYRDYTKQLNSEAREFEPWSDATSPPYPTAQSSTDDEQEPSEGGQHLNSSDDESRSIREQVSAYQEKVKEFLRQLTVNREPQRLRTAATAEDGDGDDVVGPTDRLRVNRLHKSVTADQLYTAFSRYGKVLWVRVFPDGHSCCWPSGSGRPYCSACVRFDRTESVDRAMADHRGPGCTIDGVRVSFSRSKPRRQHIAFTTTPADQ